MKHQEIQNGLIQLGFKGGWVITGDEITMWENSEPQPTAAQIAAAAVIYEKTINDKSTAAALAKSALLERLGISLDEAALLFQ